MIWKSTWKLLVTTSYFHKVLICLQKTFEKITLFSVHFYYTVCVLRSILSVQFSSVTQSCPTLCNPMNCSTPGLPVHHQLLEFTQTHAHRVGDAIQPSHPLSSPSPPAPNPSLHQGLFQWVNSLHEGPFISSIRCVCSVRFFSGIQFFAALCAVSCQASLSMGFSREEYWSAFPSPPPGHLLHPGIKPLSLISAALAGRFFTIQATWEALLAHYPSLIFLSSL